MRLVPYQKVKTNMLSLRKMADKDRDSPESHQERPWRVCLRNTTSWSLWSSWWNRTAPGRRNFDLNHKDHQDHEVDAIKYEFGDKLWRVALLYAALRRRAIFLQRSMEKNIDSLA